MSQLTHEDGEAGQRKPIYPPAGSTEGTDHAHTTQTPSHVYSICLTMPVCCVTMQSNHRRGHSNIRLHVWPCACRRNASHVLQCTSWLHGRSRLEGMISTSCV